MLILGTLLMVAVVGVPVADAQQACVPLVRGGSPNRSFDANAGEWSIHAASDDDCRGGVHTIVTATQTGPGDRRPSVPTRTPRLSSGFETTPIFCRRDDYLFLPPASLGGLPCTSVPSHEQFDPVQLAVKIAAELPPPELRIRMNPDRGMVAVPTWFWVEGYDGGSLGQSQSVLEEHETCRLVPERDADGQPLLDLDGRPRTQRRCDIERTTFNVDVRLVPSQFNWDFGDSATRSLSCQSRDGCGDALGQAYIDPFHPSPIAHPYRWSSLGQNGAEDAYTVRLGITFGAEFRVTVNGASVGGWRALPSRTLGWSASHQVQEAQAVLTKP